MWPCQVWHHAKHELTFIFSETSRPKAVKHRAAALSLMTREPERQAKKAAMRLELVLRLEIRGLERQDTRVACLLELGRNRYEGL